MRPSPARPSLRRRIVTLHRWLGVAAAIFWLVQALTGIAILFHWELRDASFAGAHRTTDLGAIERRIDVLAPRGTSATVDSVWTTAGFPDRYDIAFTDGQKQSRSARIAGDGSLLHVSEPGEGSLLDTLVDIHHNLAAGEIGDWIVGISGILLLSNLAFGLVAAWPKGRRWRQTLVPIRKGPTAARLYSWHRAVGLWAVLPAIVLVGTGTLLKFEHGFGALIGAREVSLPPVPARVPRPIGFAAAAGAALAAIPGSTLTAVAFPTPEDATYRVRVRAPGEIRRAYGAGIVLVDANDGAVRGVYPIDRAEAPRAFMSALFPIHTGEIGRLPGRLIVLTLGIWLATMVVLGLLLWQRRRPRKKRA